MSLLAQVNQPNENGYYFALEGGGGGTGNPAPQFVATGLAGAGGFVSQGAGANVTLNNGTFVSYVDTTAVPPGGAEVVVLGSDAGGNAPRWTIGYNNSDVGDGFGGADLAIKCYADNGAIIATPITIDRETATVNITEGLVVNGEVVGAPAVVGGGVLSIDGTLGLSRVYDELYNVPPGGGGGVVSITGSEYIAVTGTASVPILTATGLVPASLPFTSQSTQQQGAVAVGFNNVAMVSSTYTAPRSGLYLFSASFVCNVATGVTGFCTIGASDDVGITLFNLPTAVSYTVNLKPWSMPNTDAVPEGQDYNLTNTQVVSLVEATAYTLSGFTLNCSTPNVMVFPSFGGAGGSGCRFIANIVPLC